MHRRRTSRIAPLTTENGSETVLFPGVFLVQGGKARALLPPDMRSLYVISHDWWRTANRVVGVADVDAIGTI